MLDELGGSASLWIDQRAGWRAGTAPLRLQLINAGLQVGFVDPAALRT